MVVLMCETGRGRQRWRRSKVGLLISYGYIHFVSILLSSVGDGHASSSATTQQIPGKHKSLANVTENYIVVALQEPGRVCSVD